LQKPSIINVFGGLPLIWRQTSAKSGANQGQTSGRREKIGCSLQVLGLRHVFVGKREIFCPVSCVLAIWLQIKHNLYHHHHENTAEAKAEEW